MNGVIAEKAITTVLNQEFENGRLKRRIAVDGMIDRSIINLLGGEKTTQSA